jgi:hypothetical protein
LVGLPEFFVEQTSQAAELVRRDSAFSYEMRHEPLGRSVEEFFDET